MKTATQVYMMDLFEKDGIVQRHMRVLKDPVVTEFFVKTYNNGIATVYPAVFTSIEDWARVIEGCFAEGSNFEKEIMDTYSTYGKQPLKAIKFAFDGVLMTITKKNANAEQIVDYYWKIRDEADASAKRMMDVWHKNLVGSNINVSNLEDSKHATIYGVAILHEDKTEKFQFKNRESEKEWSSFEFKWLHSQGKAVVYYARRWVQLMQELILQERPFKEVFERTYSKCAEIDRITDTQKEIVTQAIIKSWKFGDELYKWVYGKPANSNKNDLTGFYMGWHCA